MESEIHWASQECSPGFGASAEITSVFSSTLLMGSCCWSSGDGAAKLLCMDTTRSINTHPLGWCANQAVGIVLGDALSKPAVKTKQNIKPRS